MVGLSKIEVEAIIKQQVNLKAQDEATQKVANEIAVGVAEAIEANNRAVESDISKKLRKINAHLRLRARQTQQPRPKRR
jgi:hypothetical protein